MGGVGSAGVTGSEASTDRGIGAPVTPGRAADCLHGHFSLGGGKGAGTVTLSRMTAEGNGLKVEKYFEGNGAPAQAGKMVRVHYTGMLENGQKFDSSRDRGEPIEFPLGVGYVIQGWDQGIAQLNVGDKAKLTIPASLGYGAAGVPGVIPGGATLIFDVELVDVR